MIILKDEIDKLQKELSGHKENHRKDGIKLCRHDEIANPSFPSGTSASLIEKTGNEANAHIKDFITRKMNDIIPRILRE
jgi:hypothetical protein